MSEPDAATDERESDEARDREAILSRRKALIAAGGAAVIAGGALYAGWEHITRAFGFDATRPRVCLSRPSVDGL